MQKIAKALVEFRKECPTIPYDSVNPHFGSKFASLSAIHKKIDELLGKHGLAVLQFPISEDDRAGVITRIIHDSGEMMEEAFMVPIGKADPQKACAAVSYARRYGLSGALGLVTEEDDDGEGAAGRPDTDRSIAPPQPTERPRTPARGGKGPRMSKANRDKLKKAAADRLLEVTESASEDEVQSVLKAFAESRSKTLLDLEDKDYGYAKDFISKWEPAA